MNNTFRRCQINKVTYCRHFVQSNSYVYVMIACSWLFSPVLVAPMFSPNMAPNTFWINKTCLPPSGFDDLPWILYFWIFGFLLPFIPLIGIPISIMIKKRMRFEADRRKFKEKVSACRSIMLGRGQGGEGVKIKMTQI